MKPLTFASQAGIAAAAIALLIAFVSMPVSAAQIVATVEYEPIPTPTASTVPASAHWAMKDMHPLEGATLSYLSIKAIDGFKVIGALWKPEGKSPANTTMIISVHGSGNNFTSSSTRAVGRNLSSKGYGVLAINTRQSGPDAVNRDNFYDISLDIDAAVQTAKAMGYRRFALHGQSLGNIQVQYYAATHWDPDIKGVILSGAFGNLPWKSHYLLVENEDDYRALRDAAHEALKAGKAAEDMPVEMKYLGNRGSKVSARHFLTYRDDLSAGADGTYWIRRVPDPIIVLRSQSDTTVNPFEPHMLIGAARADGSVVPAVEFHLIPDPEHANGDPGGHEFTYNSDAFTAAILKWLESKKL
jgi:pimeloyl-ACP methyl ester carboxylesterase